jgi:hypothetical protein
MGPSDPLRVGQPPKTPDRLTKPIDGRMPTIPFQIEGQRMEEKPSWPMAAAQKLADTAAPQPPEEPPAVRCKS